MNRKQLIYKLLDTIELNREQCVSLIEVFQKYFKLKDLPGVFWNLEYNNDDPDPRHCGMSINIMPLKTRFVFCDLTDSYKCMKIPIKEISIDEVDLDILRKVVYSLYESIIERLL